MKRIMLCAVALVTLAGCGITNPFKKKPETEPQPQGQVLVPCANDQLCVRDQVDVAWGSGCAPYDFPVSYRSRESAYHPYNPAAVLPRPAVTAPGGTP